MMWCEAVARGIIASSPLYWVTYFNAFVLCCCCSKCRWYSLTTNSIRSLLCSDHLPDSLRGICGWGGSQRRCASLSARRSGSERQRKKLRCTQQDSGLVTMLIAFRGNLRLHWIARLAWQITIARRGWHRSPSSSANACCNLSSTNFLDLIMMTARITPFKSICARLLSTWLLSWLNFIGLLLTLLLFCLLSDFVPTLSLPCPLFVVTSTNCYYLEREPS